MFLHLYFLFKNGEKMIKRIMNLFCRHKNSEVVCWHWTHGYNDNDIRFLEIELKCKDCRKYFFRYIKDWNEYMNNL